VNSKSSSNIEECCFYSLAVALALFLTGCAAPFPPDSNHVFNFNRDTFAYANELRCDYYFDPKTGKRTITLRTPKPNYPLHCFVMARSVRQFFYNARFDPAQPQTNEAGYRQLVDKIVRQSPRHPLSADQKVILPGYAGLRSFSDAHESLLKKECGGAWQSYFQRGHWRMLMPFSRQHQDRMAHQLLASLQAGRFPLVHLVRFPQLSINHAVLLFGAVENDKEIRFSVYDPNEVSKPTMLTYSKDSRRFNFPANVYFAGGRVDVYEIYRGVWY